MVDQNGAAISRVQITISNPDASFHTVSDEEGKFSINLPAGEYQLRSDKVPGFAATNRTLVIETGKTTQVTIVPASSLEDVWNVERIPANPGLPQLARLDSDADALVQQLRDLPTPLPATARSDGSVAPAELRRRQLYEAIVYLGPKGVLALSRALHDEDVELRKNAALALNVLAGGWFDLGWPKLDIRPALPALIAALQDSESNVRAWSAQAIGSIGPDAKEAVPDLIKLLSNRDEGSRNSACIGLRGIGPAARQALPALRTALSDPSKDVRQFAASAIESVDR